MPSTTGNIIAATACSGIIKAMRALVRRMPAMRFDGLSPNLSSTRRDNLDERSVFIIAAASMKAPSMKKTALFPNRE